MKIVNTKNIGHDAIKMLIFGSSGAGKTTLANTVKEPLLIISAESGLLSLADSEIDVIDISTDDIGNIMPKERRVDRLAQCYSYLLTEEARKKYKWIFLDSLTEISQCLYDKLKQEYPDRSDTLKLYGDMAERMRSIIKSFRDLPGYNVVVTALDSIDKDESGRRFITVDLIVKISNQVTQFFDEVFYLAVVEDNGVITRSLITGKTEKLNCKDRSGKLAFKEPADLNVVVNKIKQVKEVNK